MFHGVFFYYLLLLFLTSLFNIDNEYDAARVPLRIRNCNYIIGKEQRKLVKTWDFTLFTYFIKQHFFLHVAHVIKTELK